MERTVYYYSSTVPIVYEIQLTPTKKDVVHVSRMKRYYERSPNIASGSATDRVSSGPGVRDVNPDLVTVNGRPRQHNYETRFRLNNALTLLVFFYLMFVLSTCHCFNRVTQTQWHLSKRQVISEVTPYNFEIEFQSPCLAFKQQNISSPKLVNWCDSMFNESFIKPIERRCSGHIIKREKRLIPEVIYGAVTIASFGIGIGSYFAYFKTRKYEKKLNKFVVELTDLHDRVMRNQDSDLHIKNALQIVGIELNKTQLLAAAERNELTSDVTVATYLSYKFAEIRRILESSDFGSEYTVTQEFLSILNSSLPCAKSCPVEFTTLMSCGIDSSKGRFRMSILTRKPSDNLLVLGSESFILYDRTGQRIVIRPILDRNL